jgi:hypothetical protein
MPPQEIRGVSQTQHGNNVASEVSAIRPITFSRGPALQRPAAAAPAGKMKKAGKTSRPFSWSSKVRRSYQRHSTLVIS